MIHDFIPRLAAFAALILCLTCIGCSQKPSPSFDRFIHRDGGKLMDGVTEYRFISFNIPNLHYVEDDLRFEQAMPFRLPDEFEIDDALATIDQVGGQVARMYALSVRKPGDPDTIPGTSLAPASSTRRPSSPWTA